MASHADNPNTDPDESLSAYADGELTAREREAVEARLAVDPAARQLVDEFRRLSAEIGALPTTTAPAGFADSVGQRLEAQRLDIARDTARLDSERRSARLPGSQSGAPPARPRGSSRPRITLARWGWAASLAAAASLAILFLTKRPDGDRVAKNAAPLGPPVVANRGAVAEAVRPEAPAPAPPDLDATLLSSEAPEASPGGTDTRRRDRLADERPAPPGAPAPAPGPPGGPATAPTPPQAIVRLGVGGAALANRAFDRVLAGNGIAVEPSPPPRRVVSQLAAAGIELRPLAAERDRGKGERATAPAETPPLAAASEAGDWRLAACNTGAVLPRSDADLEFVLVDAPAHAVERCLAEVSGDTSNFVRVQVDPTETLQRGRAVLAEASPTLRRRQQLQVEPWRGYTRAAEPRRAAEKRSADASPGDNYRYRSPLAAPAPKPPALKASAEGLAYRFYNLRDEGAARRPPPAAGPLRAAATKTEQGDRVQVLFVLESSSDR